MIPLLSNGIMVLELCSGTANHGRRCAESMMDSLKHSDKPLPVRCITLDCSTRHGAPDLQVDLDAWVASHTAAFFKKFPNLFQVTLIPDLCTGFKA
jgi:hypothetical protein